mgnify:CR=1 FL=1
MVNSVQQVWQILNRSRLGLQSLEPSMHVDEFVVVEAHQVVRGAQYCLAFGALEAVLIAAVLLVWILAATFETNELFVLAFGAGVLIKPCFSWLEKL